MSSVKLQRLHRPRLQARPAHFPLDLTLSAPSSTPFPPTAHLIQLLGDATHIRPIVAHPLLLWLLSIGLSRRLQLHQETTPYLPLTILSLSTLSMHLSDCWTQTQLRSGITFKFPSTSPWCHPPLLLATIRLRLASSMALYSRPTSTRKPRTHTPPPQLVVPLLPPLHRALAEAHLGLGRMRSR